MLATEQVYETGFEYPYDDEDEALSFCDLPIYGNNDAENESDASSRWNQNSSSSSSSINEEDDCFEFVSSTQSLQESCLSTVRRRHESIMFCGKIIPPRKEDPLTKKSAYCKGQLLNPSSKVLPLIEKRHDDVRKISASSYKTSKWYMLMFGLVRIQGPMELKDIKKRQNKQSRRSTPHSNTLVGGEEILKSGGGKGMWSLLRAFSCTSTSEADCKVKASLWCVQQLRPAQ